MSKRVRAPDSDPVRQNRARAVSELLPAIHGAAFKRFGFVQSALVTRWPEIVGTRWAAASAPESLRFPPGKKADGVLTLVVRGAHAPMMQHIAPEIVERVNRFFGYAAVAKLTIRQGEVARPVPRAAPPSLKAAPVEIGEGLKTIADPELRAVLESLAAGVHAPRTLPRIS
ncbi:DciA family protein [Sphingomonas sp. RP10(2022)]|uniref:DciA family protein n=1 Tax=Sphingomonas liriopis TaxID=2949094 RepID=A0A9X2I0H3_9SPHN|nr:DciA family protein [Sphingomonas liriopis]MCP3735555.1 DciA family protein [Sphingomonas liriopis]